MSNGIDNVRGMSINIFACCLVWYRSLAFELRCKIKVWKIQVPSVSLSCIYSMFHIFRTFTVVSTRQCYYEFIYYSFNCTLHIRCFGVMKTWQSDIPNNNTYGKKCAQWFGVPHICAHWKFSLYILQKCTCLDYLSVLCIKP